MHAKSYQRHNKDKRHSLLEKYTSHFIERVVCERELDTKQNCNILTPTLLAITTFLSHSTGLLNRGPGGPVSLGAGFLYRILSPTCLIPNCSIGGLRAPSAECWLSLPNLSPTGLVFKLTDFLSSPSYIIVQRPPSSCGCQNLALIQPVHGQGYNILIDRMHLLFTQVNFLF